MFWDKKKSHSLPDLPDLPQYPSVKQTQMPRISNAYDVNTEETTDNEYSEEADSQDTIHELPSFPDSPMQKGFSQSAIKEAVTTENQENIEEDNSDSENVQMFPRNNYKVQEFTSPSISDAPYSIKSKEGKSIFVKVDKFQNALASLETVKSKLAEIEDLLKRIREIKNKEDNELSSWENEMENIKSRIQSVMTDIFDKAEE